MAEQTEYPKNGHKTRAKTIQDRTSLLGLGTHKRKNETMKKWIFCLTDQPALLGMKLLQLQANEQADQDHSAFLKGKNTRCLVVKLVS